MCNISTDSKLVLLDMLPLPEKLVFNKLVFMYKITHAKVPAYLSGLLPRTHKPYGTLRNDIVVPKPRIDIFKTSLAYSGAHLWNSLPKAIRQAPSLTCFKAQLHKHLSKV